MKNYRAELTGVFGDPVDDNPTGVVEEAAFAAKNLNYRYLTIKVLPEDLGKAMDSVKIFGMKGINLTIDYTTITPEMCVCDVIFNPAETIFLKSAAENGAKTITGLGMLVQQAALNFTLWTGVEAPVDVMEDALKKEFE